MINGTSAATVMAGVLQNEGMGYALDLASLTPVWVQRVEVLGAAQ